MSNLRPVSRHIFGIVIFLMISCILTSNVEAQNTFQGKLKYQVTQGNKKTSSMTLYSQGDNSRMDMKNPNGMGIEIISNDKSTYMVFPARKVYSEYSSSMAELMKKGSQMAGKNTTPPDTMDKEAMQAHLKKAMTGKTKMIMNHKCYEFVLKGDNGETTHVWATKDFGKIDFSGNKNLSNGPFQEMSFMGDYFPVLTQQMDAKGNITTSVKLVEISKKPLDSSIFTVPKNYRQLNMAGMMGH
jgi:hypothetical protein